MKWTRNIMFRIDGFRTFLIDLFSFSSLKFILFKIYLNIILLTSNLWNLRDQCQSHNLYSYWTLFPCTPVHLHLPTNSNLTSLEPQVLHSLKSNPHIHILMADKSSTTVILNKDYYLCWDQNAAVRRCHLNVFSLTTLSTSTMKPSSPSKVFPSKKIPPPYPQSLYPHCSSITTSPLISSITFRLRAQAWELR